MTKAEPDKKARLSPNTVYH